MSIDFDPLLPQLAQLCRKYGIAELSVFGSVARGEDGPDSDVDLLYVRGPDSVLGLAWFDIYDELEVLFGRKVDLVPKENLDWVLRERVLADARQIYATA